MKKIETFEVSREEMETIKSCLLYAKHRIEKHDKYYKPHLKYIKKMLKEIGEYESNKRKEKI